MSLQVLDDVTVNRQILEAFANVRFSLSVPDRMQVVNMKCRSITKLAKVDIDDRLGCRGENNPEMVSEPPTRFPLRFNREER